MTSMAFVGGVLPLAIATGAGAASRQSIGTGVLGGMLTATFLAIFFVPLFFVTVRKLGERWSPTSTRAASAEASPERVRQEYAGSLVDGEH
jgi:HAE1 family hydrophobic/amphiphilic exporter-1/multidrug efflux pump